MESRISLQYLAGFIDGEGCFTITPRLLPLLSIGQRDPTVLHRIKQFVGAGHVSGVTTRNLWRYAITGQNAINLTGNLIPYLVVKREEAELFITVRMIGSGRPMNSLERKQRENVRRMLQELKHERV